MPIVYGKERKGLSVRGKVKVRRDNDDLSDDDQKRFNTRLQKTSGVFSERRLFFFHWFIGVAANDPVCYVVQAQHHRWAIYSQQLWFIFLHKHKWFLRERWVDVSTLMDANVEIWGNSEIPSAVGYLNCPQFVLFSASFIPIFLGIATHCAK